MSPSQFAKASGDALEHFKDQVRKPLEAKIDDLKRQNAVLLEALEGMACQHCSTTRVTRDYNGQLAGSLVTDSGALSANAAALRALADANPPRFRIVAEFGRMVVGYWPDNDPQKEAKP